VGPDETIYTLFHDHLIAFNYNGSLKFDYSYNELCHEQIESPGWFWGLFLSEPVAFLNSLFTVDANGSGWMNVVCGYHIKLMAFGNERTLVPIPKKSLIVGVDVKTGEPVNLPLAILETSEGFVMPQKNGNQFVTLSGAISSIFHHSLNRLLPERLEVPHEPQAGLLLHEPQSRLAFAKEGFAWLMERYQLAADYMNQGEDQRALAVVAGTRPQMDSTIAVFHKAILEQGIDRPAAKSLLESLRKANSELQRIEKESHVSADQIQQLLKILQR
jgi:hypothetical protein